MREKDGRKAWFTLVYPGSGSLRPALGVTEPAKAAGLAIEPAGLGSDDIANRMHADAVLFGRGAHDPYAGSRQPGGRGLVQPRP